MSLNIIDTDTGIYHAVQQQANLLMEALAADPAACCWHIRSIAGQDAGLWNNPENIDSGASGILLLYIELYRRTRKPAYLAFADEALVRMVDWCKTHPTVNYALYTGRAGVAYTLMQRHLVDEDNSFLQDAMELMKPANEYFLQSKYTTDYLYDGRAGTLLVLIHLYRLTGEAWLHGYIESFTKQLLLNARLSNQGVYWMAEEEINCRPSTGFALGSAGIQYVLQQADPSGTNPAVQYILQQAALFTNSCWQASLQCWGDGRRDITNKATLQQFREAWRNNEPGLFELTENSSWALGAAGLVLAAGVTGTRVPDTLIEKLTNEVSQEQLAPGGLCQGWPGTALCLLNALYTTGYRSEYEQLTGHISNRLTNQQSILPDGGLMHGDAGRLYCLLQVLDPQPLTDNILLPLAPGYKGISGHSISLSLKLAEVKLEGIRRYFPRTINLLQLIAPRILKEFLEASSGDPATNEWQRFGQFIQNQWLSKPATAFNERLADLFQLEQQKLNFYQSSHRSSFHLFLHRLAHSEKILHHLNEGVDWQHTQQVGISPNIQIVYTKWNWSLDIESEAADRGNMLKKHVQNLATPPGEFENVFFPAGKFDNIESCFETAYRILLHCFDEPKTLAQAIDLIKYHIDRLSREERDILFEEIGVLEDAQGNSFIGPGQSLVMNKLRSWIHRDILSFHTHTPTKH